MALRCNAGIAVFFVLTFVFVTAGLASIIDFRSEMSAELKKLALEKTYDNSLLHEIEKEQTTSK